jgi:hypothetical protein
VRLLNLSRAEGDLSRLAEFDAAVMDLLQAHRFFEQLRTMGHNRTGIDPENLNRHVDFCAQTHHKAQAYLQQVHPPAFFYNDHYPWLSCACC